MKTAVTLTSIAAFHAHTGRDTQRQSVARFAVQETKAGRFVWIRKVSENAANLGHVELSQKSAASRALKELKDLDGLIVDGLEYVLVHWDTSKPTGGKRVVQIWAAVLKSSQK